jgi:hypothetical protein
MRSLVGSLLVLGLVALAWPARAGAQDTVGVFVTAAGEEAGFASKSTGDSVLDLTKALSKKKRLSIVREKTAADIIVRVESRDSHREAGGVGTFEDRKGRTQAYVINKNERTVHATLEIGDFKLPLSGEGTTWTQASDKVAHSIDKWVDENLVRIIEKRKDRPQQ